MASTPPASHVRLKSVAIPPEHGSWGFLVEPILLGLGIAPSAAGLCLALGVVGAFLARHPLKIAINDRRNGKRYARTVAGERFAVAYTVLAALGLVASAAMAGFSPLLPFLFAAPLVLVQLVGYTVGRGRDLLPELAGAAGLAVAASSLALAGGEPFDQALALWAILTARDVPSILYIRARLRLEKGKPFSLSAVLVTNILAVAGVIALAWAGLAPALAVAAMVMLLVRAACGLSPYRRRVRVQTLGFLEMGYGLLTVLLVIIGHALA